MISPDFQQELVYKGGPPQSCAPERLTSWFDAVTAWAFKTLIAFETPLGYMPCQILPVDWHSRTIEHYILPVVRTCEFGRSDAVFVPTAAKDMRERGHSIVTNKSFIWFPPEADAAAR